MRPAASCLLAAILLGATPVERIDSPLPELLDPSTGEPVALPLEAGVTHLCFFATWCAPCLDEMIRLTDLEARWQVEGYSLVLVAVPTRQTPDRLREFMEETDPPGRLLLDTGGKLIETLGVEDIPHHVLLDAEGRILHRTPALRRGISREIEAQLRKRRP